MTLPHQEPIEQKLSELKNIIIKYYTPTNNNGNLLNSVLFEIFICEEDLYAHYRMGELLFLSVMHLLEEQKMNEELVSDGSEEDETDRLSDREKDIITGVVKGMTNK